MKGFEIATSQEDTFAKTFLPLWTLNALTNLGFGHRIHPQSRLQEPRNFFKLKNIDMYYAIKVSHISGLIF